MHEPHCATIFAPVSSVQRQQAAQAKLKADLEDVSSSAGAIVNK
jgi:hypothetical protein